MAANLLTVDVLTSDPSRFDSKWGTFVVLLLVSDQILIISSRPFVSFQMSWVHLWISSFSVEVCRLFQNTVKMRENGLGEGPCRRVKGGNSVSLVRME